MYTVSVKRDFTAYHYLVGGNWGAENDKHAHHYYIEDSLAFASYILHPVELDSCQMKRIVQVRYPLFAAIFFFRILH